MHDKRFHHRFWRYSPNTPFAQVTLISFGPVGRVPRIVLARSQWQWCTILVLGCSCPQIFPRFGCGGCACSCAPSNPSSDIFAAVLSFLALISLLFPSHLTTTDTLGTGGQRMTSRIAFSLSARPPCIRGSIKLSRQSVATNRQISLP